MASHRILQLNALATAVCATGMLAARSALPSLFGLGSPILLDVIAAGLLAYAGALAFAAARRPVTRGALMFFTIADGAWVVGSAAVLALFWSELAVLARVLVIGVAVAVDIFALLQFRAAGTIRRRSPQAV